MCGGGCVIFDDSITCRSLWVCASSATQGGVLGGGRIAPPGYAKRSASGVILELTGFRVASQKFYGEIFAILVFFTIFSGFLN